MLDDIVSIISRDAVVMRGILAYPKKLRFREKYILQSYGIQSGVNEPKLFVKRSLESE